MEFPFGHSHHHHNHQEEEDAEEGRKHSHQHYPQRESNNPPYSYPPPGTQFPPPPQHFAHVQHHAHQGTGQVIHHEAYPSYDTPDYGPPPPNPYPRPGYDTPGGSFPRPEYEPSGGSFPRPGYEPSGSSSPRPGRMQPNLPRGQVVRVSCKADPAFSLAIRNGSAVLVHANANDEFQQWIKDETFSVKVKDERSYPSFALVNKATGQALKHGLGETQPEIFCGYDCPGIHVSKVLKHRIELQAVSPNVNHVWTLHVINIFDKMSPRWFDRMLWTCISPGCSINVLHDHNTKLVTFSVKPQMVSNE